MTDPDVAESHLPLTDLTFHVLLALGNDSLHGYGIGKEIEERTDGRLRPTTGSLYQALRRLHESGLIEEVELADDEVEDSRRQYFRLTDLGHEVVALEARRLEELVGVARRKNLLSPRG